MEIQAKNMKKKSEKKFPPSSLGATVRLIIPRVDKGQDKMIRKSYCQLL